MHNVAQRSLPLVAVGIFGIVIGISFQFFLDRQISKDRVKDPPPSGEQGKQAGHRKAEGKSQNQPPGRPPINRPFSDRYRSFYIQPPLSTEVRWREFHFRFEGCSTSDELTLCSLMVINTRSARDLCINQVDDIKIYDDQGVYHPVSGVIFGSAGWPNNKNFLPNFLTNRMPRDVGVNIAIGIAKVAETVKWLSIDIYFSEDITGGKILLPIRKAYLRPDDYDFPPEPDPDLMSGVVSRDPS